MKNKNNAILLAITFIVASIIFICLYFSNFKGTTSPDRDIKLATNTIVKLAKNLDIKQINVQDNTTNFIKTDILDNDELKVIQEKTCNKNIIFVVDTSGSMEDHLEDVKNAFSNISYYLSENSTITLISFNKDIYMYMLEENFNENGKNKFINSINSLKVNNNCCTYNALSYALSLAINKENSEIILLSDGQISMGYTYDDIRNAIPYLGVPIHTISYGNDAEFVILEEISKNTNGINIKATNENIFNQLKEIIKQF